MAALKTQAAVIVTENVKHFPRAILGPLNIEARSADDFLADTIALDNGKAMLRSVARGSASGSRTCRPRCFSRTWKRTD